MVVIAICAFLVVWIVGMTAGLTAAGCRNKHRDSDKKISLCNISIAVGSVFPGEAGKRSILYLERGIALANLGREADAYEDFKRALNDASNGKPKLMLSGVLRPTPWFDRIKERISEEAEDSLIKCDRPRISFSMM